MTPRSFSRAALSCGLLLGALCLSARAAAGAPPLFTQQGRLLDASGVPVNGSTSISFTLYVSATGGAPIWSETQTLTLDDGYFSTQLGQTTPLPVTLFAGSPIYLGIKIGSDVEMSPRETLSSVPYALVSGDATGDIHPTSIVVAGKTVVDNTGAWVGATMAGPPGPAGPAGPAGPQGPAGPLDLTKVVANGTQPQTANFNITGNGVIGGTLAVVGPATVGGSVVLGNQANESLSAAQVATLTGGGNADALHTHAGLQHAWIDAGPNDTYANFQALLAKYPPSQFQWGIVYNGIVGTDVIHVKFSSWNGGVRVITDEYITGDGNGTDPPGGFQLGGAAWFYNTPGAFDDACTGQGKFKHEYWQWAGGTMTFTGGNGCGGGEWFVRPL